MRIVCLFISVVFFFQSCKKHTSQTPIASLKDYNKGDSFLYFMRDSAYFYFNKAITSSNYDPYIAMAYNRIAKLEFEDGDYYASEENAVESLKHLDKQDTTLRYWVSYAYNIIGNDNLNQKLYDNAIMHFDSAIKFDNTPKYKSNNFNNRALAFQKKGQFNTAIAVYTSILNESKDDPKEYARIISNLARTKWLQNPDYNALPEFFNSLQIRKQINDEWGLNASYSHLSDYYLKVHSDSSLYYAQKMYEIAQKLNSVDDQLEALEKLLYVAPLKDVRAYAIKHTTLNDSIQSIRNAAKNKYALIRYDSEKDKANNLVLQKDNAQKRVRIAYQRVALLSVIFIFTIIAIWATNWYRRRKQKMELDSRNLIRENQYKTSKKVHDVVANGLYRIMNDLEHQDTIEKEKLLDRIESLYEQSRDISYEKTSAKAEVFSETIHTLLTPFATDSIRILITGNNEAFWAPVPLSVRKELEYVLLELMVNMKKHSKAQSVAIKFEHSGNELKIHYKDDGIGLAANRKQGNGMRNTETRISSIKGRIIFGGINGLEVTISVPTAF